jgi:hypothetical protein
VTVFTKNRERLLDGDIAEAFFQAVLQQARERSLLSDEHVHHRLLIDSHHGAIGRCGRRSSGTQQRQALLMRFQLKPSKEDEVAPPTFTSAACDIGCGFIARSSRGGYDMRQSPDSLALL